MTRDDSFELRDDAGCAALRDDSRDALRDDSRDALRDDDGDGCAARDDLGSEITRGGS